MKKSRSVLILWMISFMIAVSTTSGCAAAPADKPQASTPEADFAVSDPSRYQKAIFEEADCIKDIVYRQAEDYQGGTVDLALDVFQPHGDTATNRPVIVLLHSGGFVMGTKDVDGIERWLAEDFALRGYVSVIIDYRLRKYPVTDYAAAVADAAEDAAAAVDWVAANGDAYGADPDTIALIGYSAGAYIASYLAYNGEEQISWSKESVACVVSISGGYELCNPSGGDPAGLLIHGTMDTVTCPYNNSVILLEMLQNAGVQAELYPLEGADHDVYPYHTEILERTAEFLYENMISHTPA